MSYPSLSISKSPETEIMTNLRVLKVNLNLVRKLELGHMVF